MIHWGRSNETVVPRGVIDEGSGFRWDPFLR